MTPAEFAKRYCEPTDTVAPNLRAILDGRVSGSVTEWPLIRSELQTLITKIAALRADLAREVAEVEALAAENDALLIRAKRAEAEVERLRADAARYRFLRDRAFGKNGGLSLLPPDAMDAEVDAAIDAARAALGAEK